MDVLAVEVDVAEVERHDLGRPEAAGVGELEHRRVAERERLGVASGAVDRALDLLERRRLREPPRPAWRERRVRDALRPERVARERPHRRQPARDRRGGEPAARATELGGVRRQHADVQVVEPEPLSSSPTGREVPQIGGVRPPRRLGERRAREEPIHRDGRVHVYRFSPARTTPAHAPLPRHRPRLRDRRGGLRGEAAGRRRPPQERVAATLVGDSLNVGIEPYLGDELPGWRMDAHDRVGRATQEGIDELRSLGGGLAPVVVVSLGTNDADGSEPEFRKLVYQAVAIVGPRRCLVWATVVRDGTPRTGFNQVLEDARSAHPQRPPGRVGGVWSATNGELLAGDLVHGTPEGYARRAEETARAIRDCPAA